MRKVTGLAWLLPVVLAGCGGSGGGNEGDVPVAGEVEGACARDDDCPVGEVCEGQGAAAACGKVLCYAASDCGAGRACVELPGSSDGRKWCTAAQCDPARRPCLGAGTECVDGVCVARADADVPPAGDDGAPDAGAPQDAIASDPGSADVPTADVPAADVPAKDVADPGTPADAPDVPDVAPPKDASDAVSADAPDAADVVDPCAGQCAPPFPRCVLLDGVAQCVQCAQDADCAAIDAACVCGPYHACQTPDGGLCAASSCTSSCATDADCAPSAAGTPLLCATAAPAPFCYDPAGTCDATACCPAGTACYDIMGLLFGGMGGGGLPGGGMQACTCDDDHPCVGTVPCTDMVSLCVLPMIGDIVCPGGSLPSSVPAKTCFDVSKLLGGLGI